ncbi:MAG: ASCH domain-containing protein [Sphaerospermopsis kisseleviana]
MISKPIIFSIKPKFSTLIFCGKKKIELRRRISEKISNGSILIIYESSPTQSIVGYAKVKRVIKQDKEILWKKHGKQACVSKSFFKDYFQGLDLGFAIELEDPYLLSEAIPLNILQRDFSFTPPQSYMYATPELLKLIQK